MDKELIERLAVASVEKPSKDRLIGRDTHMGLYLDIGEYAIPIGDIMYSFAALVADECIRAIQTEVDHAAINGHAMAPDFGKITPVPAIRRAYIEAALAGLHEKFSLSNKTQNVV